MAKANARMRIDQTMRAASKQVLHLQTRDESARNNKKSSHLEVMAATAHNALHALNAGHSLNLSQMRH